MSNSVNLHNRTLSVAMNISPPYVFLKHSGNREITDGGSEIALLDTLAKHFNFQYEVVNMNASWGMKFPNGSWNGLMRRILDKKSDIGLGGITLNFDRYEALPFLYPHIVSRVTFLSPAPQTAPNLYLGLKPFTYDVWTAFIFALVGCFIVDRLYYLVCGRSFFLISIYAMFRQQYKDDYTDWFKRIWMIFWILFTFILTTAYAGNLVSLITIPIRMKTLDTIQDLLTAAESNQITITGLNSAYFDALQKSSLPVYKALSKYLNEVKSKNEGYSLVASGRTLRQSTTSSILDSVTGKNHRQYAFISTEESLKYGQSLWGENRIYMTSDLDRGAFFIDLLALPVRTNFPYRAQFNRAIMHLLEAGIFNHWQDLEYRKLKRHSHPGNESTSQENGANHSNEAVFDEFNISQLQSFFFLYLFGVCLSTLVFIFEMIYFRIGLSTQ